MLLMNVCQVHGVLNKFVNELLALLHLHLLSKDNCLLSSMYQAKVFCDSIIDNLGGSKNTKVANLMSTRNP